MAVNKEHKEFHTLDMGAGWALAVAPSPAASSATVTQIGAGRIGTL